VDYAFKKVFGSETTTPILADLLHAVLKPAHRIVELPILNPFNTNADGRTCNGGFGHVIQE
jgi:hypothetical protein